MARSLRVKQSERELNDLFIPRIVTATPPKIAHEDNGVEQPEDLYGS